MDLLKEDHILMNKNHFVQDIKIAEQNKTPDLMSYTEAVYTIIVTSSLQVHTL